MTAGAYYNENDPKAAAWLRELISAGLIAPGDVDTRSITEISPHEITGYTQQHFFAGIGGWSLALRLAGWPDSRPVRTGSCPCQPFSQAGQGKGEADERHLWPVFRDLIAFGTPSVAFGEQVASAAGRQWLARVRADLEALGYGFGAADLCAASVGAPHIRQRLFWVADPGHESTRRHARSGETEGGRPFGEPSGCGTFGRLGDAKLEGLEGQRGDGDGGDKPGRVDPKPSGPVAAASVVGFWDLFELLQCTDGKARRIESGSFPLAHGVPGRVGLLRGYGNAIVPQVAAEFVKAFLGK